MPTKRNRFLPRLRSEVEAEVRTPHLGRLRRGGGGGPQRARRRKQDEPVAHQKSSLPMSVCINAWRGALSADSQ